jgi:peroxiredoxin
VHARAALLTVVLSFFATAAIAADRETDPWRSRVLVGPDTKVTSLAERASGHRLVVVTMKGHGCRVCLGQLARLAALDGRLSALKARVVGLDADTPQANAEATRRLGISLAILSDRSHRVLDALGLWRRDANEPMPAIVVYDECGKERGRLVGRRPGQRDEDAVVVLLERIASTPPVCRGEPNA